MDNLDASYVPHAPYALCCEIAKKKIIQFHRNYELGFGIYMWAIIVPEYQKFKKDSDYSHLCFACYS